MLILLCTCGAAVKIPEEKIAGSAASYTAEPVPYIPQKNTVSVEIECAEKFDGGTEIETAPYRVAAENAKSLIDSGCDIIAENPYMTGAGVYDVCMNNSKGYSGFFCTDDSSNIGGYFTDYHFVYELAESKRTEMNNGFTPTALENVQELYYVRFSTQSWEKMFDWAFTYSNGVYECLIDNFRLDFSVSSELDNWIY